jgi:hypothetical protein
VLVVVLPSFDVCGHKNKPLHNVLLTCIIVYQYSETNVKQFLFNNLLRINASTCFEHYLLILRKSCTSGTWYTACVLCRLAAPGLTFHCITLVSLY